MRAPWFDRVSAWASLVLLGVGAIAFVTWVPSGPGGPPFADFAAYYAAGHTWSHGGDPYSPQIWNVERMLPGFDAGRLELMPFVGPPLSLSLWALLGAMSFPWAVALWTTVVALAAVVIVVVAYTLVCAQRRRADIVPLVFLALSAAPITIGISAGQTALPAIAAVLVAIACAVHRKYAAMGLAIVAAGMLKPNVALVLVAASFGVAACATTALAAAFSLAGNTLLASGIAGLRTYLRVIAEHTRAEQTFAFQYAPLALAYGFGALSSVAEGAATIIASVAIAATAIWAWLARASLLARTAVAAAALPFVLPYLHEPDMAIAVLPALYAVLRARGAAWAFGAAGTVMVLAYPLALTQGPAGVAFALAMSAICALQVARFAPHDDPRLRLAPLGVVPLLALLALFAPHGHVMIWPATVPAITVLTPEMSAATIWRTELTALHLDGPQPWIAVLRAFTLAGCALVGIAAALTAREEARSIAVEPQRTLPPRSAEMLPRPVVFD